MVKKFWSNKLHRRINDALSIVVLLLAGYLILAPFAPNAGYYTKQIVAAQPENKSQDTQAKTAQLYIPKIDFDQPILEGENAQILSRGIWRRPNTSKPDLGGNTVIVGHRFYRSRPADFYHLDKLKNGDSIQIDWDYARYTYEVTNTLVVNPDATHIEADSDEPMLTLYTCTPLWTATNRLVIQAKLVETSP